MSVTTSGLDDLVRGIDQVVDGLHDLTDAGTQAGEAVVLAADPPIRTGRLASTVRSEPGPAGVTILAGGIAGVDYAPPVEARTGFMRKAVAAREAAIVDRYQDQVDRLVRTNL